MTYLDGDSLGVNGSQVAAGQNGISDGVCQKARKIKPTCLQKARRGMPRPTPAAPSRPTTGISSQS